MDDVVAGAGLQASQSQSRAHEIARLFAAVFERDSVELDDDFFQLGGDSLLAEALAAEIERSFGFAIPISILMEASTPLALAATLLDTSRRHGLTALITVRAEGEGPALFCIHGMAGESLLPRRLVTALARNCPIYAFRAIGVEPGERPLTSIKAMADSYLAAMRTAQPGGPYIIVGTCGGALIAQDIAQQLAAVGESVQALVLVDPLHDELAPFLHETGLRLEIVRSGWAKRAAEIYSWFDAHPEATSAERRNLVWGAMAVACGTYTPAPWKGATLLVATSVRMPALLNSQRGYPTLLSELSVVEIDAEHERLFDVRAPDVARAMDAFLARVAPLA